LKQNCSLSNTAFNGPFIPAKMFQGRRFIIKDVNYGNISSFIELQPLKQDF